MPHRRTVGIALALAVVACGGDDDAADEPGPTTAASTVQRSTVSTAPATVASSAAPIDDPCALLTNDEVAVAFGADSATNSGETSIGCRWTPSGTDIEAVVDVNYLPGTFDDFVEPAFEQIPGVGTEAYWDAELSNILVAVDEQVFSIQLLRADAVDQRAVATELAVAIAARL